MSATAVSAPTNAASGNSPAVAVAPPMTSATPTAIAAVAPSPAPAADAEQVRVGQRVAEHALVAAAGQGEHRADQQPEHDPGQAQLGDDRGLALGQPAVDVHAGDAG